MKLITLVGLLFGGALGWIAAGEVAARVTHPLLGPADRSQRIRSGLERLSGYIYADRRDGKACHSRDKVWLPAERRIVQQRSEPLLSQE